MSTQKEQRQAIRHAIDAAIRKLKELDAKPNLTRAELFERDMTIECIQRGEKLLGEHYMREGDVRK